MSASDVRAKGRRAFRLFVTEGVPASGANEPDKTEIIDFTDETAASILALEQGQADGFLVFSTWAELNAVPEGGLTDGVGAKVYDDPGTHADPITGLTVDNEGVYSFVTGSPNGFKRIANLEAEDAREQADRAEAAFEATAGLIEDAATIDGSLQAITPPNEQANADFAALPYPILRAGSPVRDLVDQPALAALGYVRAVQWRNGGEYFAFDSGGPLADEYVFGAFLVECADPVNQPSPSDVQMYSSLGPDGAAGGMQGIGAGQEDAGPGLVLHWQYAQATPVETKEWVIVGANGGHAPGSRWASLPFFIVSSSSIDTDEVVNAILTGLETLRTKQRIASIAEQRLIDGGLVAEEMDSRLRDAPSTAVPSLFATGSFDADPPPQRRSGSEIVILPAGSDPIQYGYTRAMRVKTGVSDFARDIHPTSLNGQYILVSFLAYSADPDHLPTEAFLSMEVNPDATTPPANTEVDALQSGVVDLTPNLRLLWRYGLVGTNRTRLIAGAIHAGMDTDPVFYTGFEGTDSGVAFDPLPIIAARVADEEVRRRRQSLKPIPAATDAPLPKLVLFGSGSQESYVEVQKGGDLWRHTFQPFRDTLFDFSSAFNFARDIIVGAGPGGADLVWRDAQDDISPLRALGDASSVGANHGYRRGRATSVGHGKTSEDFGSVWARAGVQYVLLNINGPDEVYLARRTGDSVAAFPAGEYTHVSGAVHTASFTIGAPAMADFYPIIQERRIDVFVDGVPVERVGEWEYRENVQFRETYFIRSRTDVIESYVTDGADGFNAVSASPIIMSSNTYTYDVEGNCLFGYEVAPLVDLPDPRNVMLFQSGGVLTNDGPIRRYIPKTTPITHEGDAYDFANIAVIDPTSWSSDLEVPVANCVGTGLLASLFVSLTDNFAAGFGILPVLSGAQATRRANVVNYAMTLSIAAAKTYIYVLSDPTVTELEKGDGLAIYGFRAMFRRSDERTALYTVRIPDGPAYVFADWHDRAGIDTLILPPDLFGREWVVVEKSANVTVLTQGMTGAISVELAATGSNAQLMLKVGNG